MSPENSTTNSVSPSSNSEHVVSKKSSLREAIFYLADASNPVALTSEDINPEVIKKSLGENGLIIDALSQEARKSLSLTKFHDFDSQDSRGFGVKIALGDNFHSWEKQIEILSSNYNWSIDGDKTRGLKQLTADTIACAAGIITPEEYANRTNRRFWKEHERKGKITPEKLKKIFFGVTPPEKKTTSFPLNAGVTMISYLTDEN